MTAAEASYRTVIDGRGSVGTSSYVCAPPDSLSPTRTLACVASSPRSRPAPPCRRTHSEPRRRGWCIAGRTDSGPGSRRTGGSGWAMPGSASSTWPTGDQPIASEDGALQIVVNGEFYDFERDPRRAETARASAPHPLRQRDRPAPLRGPRHRLPAPACAASSPSCSGTAATNALRRPRSLRHQAALSTRTWTARCTWPPRSRPCSPPACPPAGTAPRSSRPSILLGLSRTARSSTGIHQVPPGHYLLATARHGPSSSATGTSTTRRRRSRGQSAPTPSTPSGSARRWTRRSGCACGPTCRSAAT